MIVKASLWILHELFYVPKLLKAILTAFKASVSSFIFHIEWLCHIKAIKPYLIRIDIFVPEVTIFCTRHGCKLGSNGVHCFSILLFSSKVIEFKKACGTVDVVYIVFFNAVGLDRSVFIYKPAKELVCKIKILLITAYIIKIEKTCDHAAINIVPLIGLAT